MPILVYQLPFLTISVDHEKHPQKITSSENPFSAKSKNADMSQKRKSFDQQIMIF